MAAEMLPGEFPDGQLDRGRIASVVGFHFGKSANHSRILEYINDSSARNRKLHARIEVDAAGPQLARSFLKSGEGYGTDLTAEFAINPALLGECGFASGATSGTASVRNRWKTSATL